VKAAMAQGLLLVPAGPQVVRFVPPLIVNADQVQEALIALEKALAGL
jgi:acetylornithine/N-succinyldiaminopimelate aminotransferase